MSRRFTRPTKPGQARRAVLVDLGMAVAASVAGGATYQVLTSEKSLSPVVVGDVDQVFPDETLSDWRNYSDFVVLATVIDSNAIPASEEDLKLGEGVFLRRVSLTIDRVLWHSPFSHVTPPTTITFTYDGWHFGQGKETTRFRLGNTVDIQNDRQYLIPLTRFGEVDEYAPLTPASVMPVTSGIVGQDAHYFAERGASAESATYPRKVLKGLSPSDVSEVLESVRPTLSSELGTLSPRERYKLEMKTLDLGAPRAPEEQ